MFFSISLADIVHAFASWHVASVTFSCDYASCSSNVKSLSSSDLTLSRSIFCPTAHHLIFVRDCSLHSPEFYWKTIQKMVVGLLCIANAKICVLKWHYARWTLLNAWLKTINRTLHVNKWSEARGIVSLPCALTAACHWESSDHHHAKINHKLLLNI